jgi:hypothetical protein
MRIKELSKESAKVRQQKIDTQQLQVEINRLESSLAQPGIFAEVHQLFAEFDSLEDPDKKVDKLREIAQFLSNMANEPILTGEQRENLQHLSKVAQALANYIKGMCLFQEVIIESEKSNFGYFVKLRQCLACLSEGIDLYLVQLLKLRRSEINPKDLIKKIAKFSMEVADTFKIKDKKWQIPEEKIPEEIKEEAESIIESIQYYAGIILWRIMNYEEIIQDKFDYHEVRCLAESLTPDEQIQLIEDLSSSIRQRVKLRPKPKRSILELRGLGKEIWNGIDAQEYVNQERGSWNG